LYAPRYHLHCPRRLAPCLLRGPTRRRVACTLRSDSAIHCHRCSPLRLASSPTGHSALHALACHYLSPATTVTACPRHHPWLVDVGFFVVFFSFYVFLFVVCGLLCHWFLLYYTVDETSVLGVFYSLTNKSCYDFNSAFTFSTPEWVLLFLPSKSLDRVKRVFRTVHVYLCPLFFFFLSLNKVEGSRESRVTARLSKVERSFEGHVIARVSFIRDSNRVEGFHDNYTYILLCFDVYTAFCCPFLSFYLMFKGSGHL
jgi:hypothetical protein